MARVKIEAMDLREGEAVMATIMKGEQKYGKDKGTPFLSFFCSFKSMSSGVEAQGNYMILNSKGWLVKQFFDMIEMPYELTDGFYDFDDDNFKGRTFYCTITLDDYGWKVKNIISAEKAMSYKEEGYATEEDPFAGKNPFAKE